MFRRGKQQEWAMRTMLRHVPRQARRVYRRGTPLAATELGACLVHIVCSARLRVYQTAPAGDEITLALLSPASCFSLAWLDQRSRENTCAMAITETAEVVSLAEAAFRALL